MKLFFNDYRFIQASPAAAGGVHPYAIIIPLNRPIKSSFIGQLGETELPHG